MKRTHSLILGAMVGVLMPDVWTALVVGAIVGLVLGWIEIAGEADQP